MRNIGHAKPFASTKDIDRETWLKLRSHGIGGSDIPQISGVSKWGNALKIYLSKIDPLHDNGEQSEAAEIGQKIEDFVAQLWMDRNPDYKLERVNQILQHPEWSWALANIDRVVISRVTNEVVGVYEGKSAGIKADWKDDEVPDDYYLQGQWYLAVTGLPRIFYGALLGGFGGFSLADPQCEADTALHEDLFTIGERFWQMVIDKTPPAIDGTAASAAILKHLFPQAEEGVVIELPSSMGIKAGALVDAKAKTKASKLHEDQLANEIKMEIGDAQKAFCPGYNFSWPTISSAKFDKKAFGADHPDLLEKYTNESTYRRFTMKEV